MIKLSGLVLNDEGLPFYYIADYHPWHDGHNPKFDEFSGNVISVKKMRQWYLNKFIEILNPILPENVVITVVPPSDSEKKHSGIRYIGDGLSQKRINGIFILNRHTAKKKATEGGDRSKQIHLDTINVVDPDKVIPKSKIILLDDVSTSGGSLEGCIELLMNAGALDVTPVVLGRTV